MGIHKFAMPHKVRQYIVKHGMVRVGRTVWSNGEECLIAYGSGNIWGLWAYDDIAPKKWFFFEKGGRH